MNNKFIDLFAGTGAFSYILEKNGFDCVFANDMVESSKKIYELNNKEGVFKLGNLNDIDINDIPQHNILCGGFPCQPFSIAGLQKGFNDERSNVFWKIIKILQKHKPEIIILENVKNLQSHDKGNTFTIIKKELEDSGYNIKYKILDTSKLTDVPHHRERIYIIGFRDKNLYDKFDFDFPTIDNKNILDFLVSDVDEKYYYKEHLKVYDKLKEAMVKNIDTNTLYQYRRYYVRENKSNVCPTLTANMGSGGHNVPLLLDNKGIRKLTPRECFNLQGFPNDYVLPSNLSNTKLYKLIGNAVSVPIIELIINKIKSIISS